MLHPVLALLAALWLAVIPSVVAGQEDFQPGPENNPQRCEDLWKGVGLPDRKDATDENFTIVCHLGYIAGHNNETKTPDWIVEHLTFRQVSGTATRAGARFRSEPAVPKAGRAAPKDYQKSGFDQGHQAPAADFKGSKELIDDTFFLSNSVPQVGIGFNRHIWQELEEHIQNLVKENKRNELYVVTGPVYQTGKVLTVRKSADACKNEIRLPVLDRRSICQENRDDPRVRCEAGVAVPAALYKIIFDPANSRVNAFLMPNIDHGPLRADRSGYEYLNRFRVSVSSVESLTGLRFFTAMTAREQRKLRETCPPTMLH
jgi:DNA/RNA endonuclease G (NUC1)